MKKVLGTLTKVEQVIMVATFVIMVASSFAQVVNRNIFKLPIAWFDEASTYCMIYMALIGTEIGLRDGTQIAVTAVVDKLHGAGKKIVQIASKIVVLIFSVSVLIAAVNMGKSTDRYRTDISSITSSNGSSICSISYQFCNDRDRARFVDDRYDHRFCQRKK